MERAGCAGGVVRAALIGVAGFVTGWLCCLGQGLWGSKLYALLSRDDLGDDRHDVWPTNLESAK